QRGARGQGGGVGGAVVGDAGCDGAAGPAEREAGGGDRGRVHGAREGRGGGDRRDDDGRSVRRRVRGHGRRSRRGGEAPAVGGGGLGAVGGLAGRALFPCTALFRSQRGARGQGGGVGGGVVGDAGCDGAGGAGEREARAGDRGGVHRPREG